MNRRLESLSLILKVQIFRSLNNIHTYAQQVAYLAKQLEILEERVSLLGKLRQERFLSRENILNYDSLLEHLKTLQDSLYKRHSESMQFLLKNTIRLSNIINRRKIIEKIKNNRYSKTKR
ncbi:hypothetical protein [Chlamydia pecorum]|uniref:hypothetical protein n=1 Tax=Chlamydia pecorum TaxID=85991 RepID=UPI00388E318C